MPKTKDDRLTLKQAKWLKYYFETGCQAEAARQAGYKCKDNIQYSVIGSQNYEKLKPFINKWLDENGLSEVRLKEKLNYLLDARETKFFAHEGCVRDEREVEALGIQKDTLKIALKVKGMYAPTKIIEETKDVTPELEELEKENKRLDEMLKKMNDKTRIISKNNRK